MKRNNTWKVILILFVVFWSLWSLYPPSARDLLSEFQRKAANTDATFQAIVARARQLQAERPAQPYLNLLEAIGTNRIARYFPSVDVSAETHPTQAILNNLQKEGAGKIKLGLDLQGGQSFLVRLDTNKMASADVQARVRDQAVEVLRKRVDKFGVAEPVIMPAGEDRILIQLPGLSEAEKESARNQISKAAFLEFRMVHPESREMIASGLIEPGYEILKTKRKLRDGREVVEQYLVEKKSKMGLTGKNVKSASVVLNPMSNEPEIDFTLDKQGADIFAQITRDNIGKMLAIVLDGELYSAPVIHGEIPNGRGQISGGNFTVQSAYELANVLQNPLEAPVSIETELDVDPSLGKDSIRSGVRSAVIATVAVAAFMASYYLVAGLVANLAMILNLVILMGVMCSIGSTLTLPGIAGMVLTVGMSVDANVLIYERIREELKLGKSLRGALAAGYSKAFSTILDSHITTFISAVILIFMGTGPVKGFGVTLTIGVSLSMFTSLVVTRVIFDWLLAKNWLRSLPMLQAVRPTQIDFLRYAKPAFALSWALALIGIGYGFYRGEKVMGVDFAGGDSLSLGFVQRVDQTELRHTIDQLKVGEPTIQFQKNPGENKETLRITTRYNQGTNVFQALNARFPQAKFQQLQLERIGPSVGQEIQKTAIVAALLSLFGILVYVAFRYEFSFAVGAVVAVVHDVLMTLGWFFLTNRQLSAPMVAAVLTIIGFSINDTIVIFDRIREDLKMGVRGTFKDVMNRALNQTLSRTIITSGTVFLATLALYLFGGGVINDFAFTFLVGILTGTYSSIFIASALVLWWHKGERPKTSSQVMIDNSVTARV